MDADGYTGLGRGNGEPAYRRLFVAFRPPQDVVAALASWQQRWLADVFGVRPTPSFQFHVTAVFLGRQPASLLGSIVAAARAHVQAAPPPVFRIGRYHETVRVGMLTLADAPIPGESWSGRGGELTGKMMLAFEAAGIYKREFRPWRPHVTMARFRQPPRLTLPPPTLAPFSPLDVALFESILRPDGADHQVVEAFDFAR